MRTLRPLLILLTVVPMPLVTGCPDTPDDPPPATSPGIGISPTLGEPAAPDPSRTPVPGPMPSTTPPPSPPAPPTAPPTGQPGSIAPVVGNSAAPGGTPPSMAQQSPLVGRDIRLRAHCVHREISDDIYYVDPRARTCTGETLPPEILREFDLEEGAGSVSLEADGRALASWHGNFATFAGWGRSVGMLSPDGQTLTVDADRNADGLIEAADKNERVPGLTTCPLKVRWQNVRDTFHVVVRSDSGKLHAEGRSETYYEIDHPPGAGCYECGGLTRFQMECTYSIDEPATPQQLP